MQNIPNGWSDALSGLYRMETKVEIAGVEYFNEHLDSVYVKAAMFAGNTLSIGGCVAKEIDISLYPQGDIPRMAEMRLFCRPVSQLSAGEWLLKGVYYIDTRQMDYQSGVLTIHGYDAMLKAEQTFLEELDDTVWPKTMPAVVGEIAMRMGVGLDARSLLHGTYYVDYPLEMTMREVLGYIAAAHGGNWIINDAGDLRLIPVFGEFDFLDIDKEAQKLDTAPSFAPFSGVRFWKDDKNPLFAGDDSGRILEADCPWATEHIVSSVLEEIAGKIYQPFDAYFADITPAAELGDTVHVAGVRSVLCYVNTSFDAACFSDIGAPADEELDHEYPYLPKQERETKRGIAANRSLIEKTASEIKLRVENVEGDVSSLQLSSQELAARVEDNEGDIAQLIMDSGQVSVSVTDGKGRLNTTIDASTWQAVYKLITGEVKSGFYFDFGLGRFVYDGTGVYRSEDGTAYIQIENDGIALYAEDGTGGVDRKLHIGFNSAGGVAYPYVLMGAPQNVGQAGLVKKFENGLFIGNGHAVNANGNFVPQTNYTGIFVNTDEGVTYVVNGTIMQNVYTGAAIAKFK